MITLADAKRVLAAAERKAEQKRTRIRNQNQTGGTFTAVPPPSTIDTNIAVPLP